MLQGWLERPGSRTRTQPSTQAISGNGFGPASVILSLRFTFLNFSFYYVNQNDYQVHTKLEKDIPWMTKVKFGGFFRDLNSGKSKYY